MRDKPMDAEAGHWLTAEQRWHQILAHAMRGILGGRQLSLPARLMAPT